MQDHGGRETKRFEKKLIGEKVIEEILNKHDFKNFKIILHRKNSKCSYRKNNTTILKLDKKEASEESAKSIIVAAHEASHALNYREGMLNLKFMELFNKLFLSFIFAFCIISPFTGWSVWWGLIFFVFNIVSFKIYYKLYTHDELITEKRALKELKSIWENIHTNISFEEIEETNKIRIQEDILGQVFVQNIALLSLLIVLIILYTTCLTIANTM